MFESVPTSLRASQRWGCWVYVFKNAEKPRKLPVNPRTGEALPVDRPELWGTFEDAVQAVVTRKANGIGYLLGEGVVGIDIDNCVGDDMAYWVRKLVERSETYAELSPSGKGVHLLFKSEVDAVKSRFDYIGVEFYSRGRYFTFTGKQVSQVDSVATSDNFVDFIREAQDANEYVRRKTKEGSAMAGLFKGDFSRYASQSEADFALMASVISYVNGDLDRARKILWLSGLARDKWERPDGWFEKQLDAVYQIWQQGQGAELDRVVQLQQLELTDDGNLKRFHRRFGERFMLIPDNFPDSFYFDGNRWKPDKNRRELQDMVQTTLRMIEYEAEQTEEMAQKIAIVKWHITCGNGHRIMMLRQLVLHDKLYIVGLDEADIDPWLIGTSNGILDLQYNDFRTGRPEDLVTKSSPVIYDPTATCPNFIQFVEMILPDADTRQYVQRLLGSCLLGFVRDKFIHIFYGSGQNGKSTLLETVARVLGDYARKVPADSLTGSGYGKHSEARARLVGSRLAFASEPPEGASLDDSFIKEVTGGERISARFLHRNSFEFVPTFKLVLTTNRMPTIRSTDAATRNRVRIVEFDQTIPPEKIRPFDEVFAMFEREQAGIFNWLIDGKDQYLASGLGEAPAVQRKTYEYRDDNDPLRMFIAETLVPAEGQHVSMKELVILYKTWCVDMGLKPVMISQLKDRMRDEGIGVGAVRLTATGGLVQCVIDHAIRSGSDF